MDLRRFARRHVPARLRLEVALARRALRDWHRGVTFATTAGEPPAFPHVWARYARPFIDYPGQERLGAAKRRNQALLAATLDRAVIAPGEVFSVWKLAGRPTAAAGYLPAAALKDRRLTTEVGGAICLLSTALYNAALLAGMEIVERHCHSVDSYGERRYFELARDAAIEYGYLDLRFRNTRDHALFLRVQVAGEGVIASLLGPTCRPFSVELITGRPIVLLPAEILRFDPQLPAGVDRLIEAGLPGLRVDGERVVYHCGGRIEREPLLASHHHPVDRIVARGGAPRPP